MKKFKVIFSYEYFKYLKSKSFIISTLVISIIILVITFLPFIFSLFNNEDENKPKMYISCAEDMQRVSSIMKDQFKQHNVFDVSDSQKDQVIEDISKSHADLYIEFKSFDNYDVYAKSNVNFITYKVDAILKQLNFNNILTPDQMSSFNNLQINKNIINLSNSSSSQNQFYLLIIISVIILLYMSILTYGMQVGMGIVTEKNSRITEILITSVKPIYVISGKVMAYSLIGLTQILILISVGFVGYLFNASYLKIDFASLIQGFDFKIIIFAVIFYLVGYITYSFIIGAFGSLVQTQEELNSIITPFMLVMVGCFYFVLQKVIQFSTNGVPMNDFLSYFLSYFPLTSPIAMFSRYAISSASEFEVLISILICALFNILIIRISAKLYKKGMLINGSLTKFRDIVKLIKSN